MPPINDYQVYTNEMRKGMEDKLFFFDFLQKHPEITNFIDFGCADGSLLACVNKKFPNLKLYGIDENKEMLNRASILVPGNFINARKLPIFKMKNITALNLSSVLHEVFFYSSINELDEFFDSIKQGKYKYIFIRDMLCPEISTIGDNELSQDVIDRIDLKYKKQRLEFEKYYNTDIKYNKRDFIHFLLKYTYSANWERELEEDYFSYNISMLMAILKNYEIITFSKYTLPFKSFQVFNDFGYSIDVPTHYKAILKLKD